MKLAKSLLLGTAATIVATAGAYAADLPSKKAAPVTYVKICDAYGAGFFFIPGTDTCIKVGGRMRADYAMSGKKDVFSASYTATTGSAVLTAPATGGTVTSVTTTTLTAPNTVASAAGAQNMYGWEARGRVDLDARTSSAYGTVQTVVSLRLARTTGVLDQTGPALSSASAAATLEAAYIRFAGFTFGAAKDNFSFMPSTFYGAGHWSSFANGAKQLAYTAVLGGGFSATIAIQDATDTTAGGVTVGSYLNATAGTGSTPAMASIATASTLQGAAYSYNNMPQLNGRIDYDQSWGSASLMGAVGKAVSESPNDAYSASKTTYAIGGGVKVNLPMIAAGDVLWLNAAYANGMTEYTTNWTSFKSSDTKRNVGGYVVNHPSWISTYDATGTAGAVETLKSWDIAAIYTHFWAPQWRQSVLASYGKVNGTDASKRLVFGQAGAFGDAAVFNVGTQLAYLPVKDFEIGVDVLYARVDQDVRKYTAAGITAGTGSSVNNALNAGLNATGGTIVSREKTNNWTGRLRVERTF